MSARVEVRDHRTGARSVRLRVTDSVRHWSGPAPRHWRDAGSPEVAEPSEIARYPANLHSVRRDGGDVVIERHALPLPTEQQFGASDGETVPEQIEHQAWEARQNAPTADRRRAPTEDRAVELRARDRKARDQSSAMLRSMNAAARKLWAGR